MMIMIIMVIIILYDFLIFSDEYII
jgi:hypothetical protein